MYVYVNTKICALDGRVYVCIVGSLYRPSYLADLDHLVHLGESRPSRRFIREDIVIHMDQN